MATRIPGLDLIYPPGFGRRPPNIFDNFFPIPDNNGGMRSEDEYYIYKHYNFKAPLTMVKALDEETGDHVTIVIHDESDDPDEDFTDILLELGMLRELSHKNVLKFIEPIKGSRLDDVAFVFETHSRNMAEMFKENHGGLFQPRMIKTIMSHLFTGLSYLHKKNIIHLDIQPENLLFTFDGMLKIWNFRYAWQTSTKLRKLKVNEFRYQPLELLLQSGQYEETVDIWSAICIFAQLWLEEPIFTVQHGREVVILSVLRWFGYPREEIWPEFSSLPGADRLEPFRCHEYNMLDNYFRKKCKNRVPASAMDLMHLCFFLNPKHRPKAQDVLKHLYFNEQPVAYSPKAVKSILTRATVNRYREQHQRIQLEHRIKTEKN